nr:uncharacterized protein LOC112029511 [Quercus suber]POF03481.1 hypothetical protein CFP56_52044 [Quercus suber]
MATNLLPFRPSVISACSSSGQRKPDPSSRKSGGGGGSSSANWWTPLFGWSSEPDYIDSGNSSNKKKRIESEKLEMEPDLARTRTRFTPGCFTEEKAKQLRMMIKETESFHDKMYHSAIASRLATDFKNSSDL